MWLCVRVSVYLACVCVCVYLYENWILSKMIEFSINKFDLQQLRNVFQIF